jgi:cephalosporin-C deacetylase-like acetyl esterase
MDSLSPAFASRREMLHLAGGLALSGLGLPSALRGQSPAPAAPPGIDPYQRFPRMVHEYYVTKVRGIERRGLEKKAALSNQAEAEAYIAEVREKIVKAFAPMPTKKTPLNAKVTGVIERDTYTVEKILFESRPKFYVTANLYLPKNRPGGKVPGVVGSCGHSQNGKCAEAYQSFAQGLARLGTACLIFDPIGQGERSQYIDPAGTLLIKGTTTEHNHAGNQMELVGEFLGSWRAWDGIRALDYLLSRPEIDPQHVGITGNSGGGTMSTWLIGLERRWTMGAPACFVTTWRRNLENELPQDNEQCPPRALAYGLDHDDFLAAMAPKPIIILAQSRDYFDARGSEESYGRLRHLYKLLGAEKNIQLHIGPDEHGYSQPNREAMYRFFNSLTGASEAATEPALVIEEDKTLQCSPTGQVVLDPGSRTVFSFTQAKAERLKNAREAAPLSGAPLKEAVRETLKLPQRDPAQAPDYRILRSYGPKRGYPKDHWIHYAVATEPGIHSLCTVLFDAPHVASLPAAPEGEGKVVLWIAEQSADAELREDPTLSELASTQKPGTLLVACDVRGVGESLPVTAGNQPHSYYGSDYFYAAFANMLGKPYLGGKTHDALRVIDLLASRGWTEIHLAAKGKATLIAGLAACLDDRVKLVTLDNRLESWHSLATEEHYQWPLSHMLFGVLKTWDLPEVWKSLESRMA